MKHSKFMALSKRLLGALAITTVSVAGLSGIAEAATCYTCHAPVGSSTDLRPVAAAWRNITTGGIQGSHIKHMPTATTSTAACTPCHGAAVTTYTTGHTLTGNGLISVPNGTYSKGTSFAQTGSPVYGSCSAATCHVTAYGTSFVTSPTWGVTAANCTACHTGVGAFTGTGSAPATGSHTKHMAATAVVVNCASCHTGASANSNGGTYHTDGNIDVTNGYPANVTKHAVGLYTGTCNSASCHVSAYGTQLVTSSTWGTPGCVTCHSGTGAFTGTGSAPVTGSHTKHLSVTSFCGDCHAGAVSQSSGGSQHMDGHIDVTGSKVAGGYPANVTKHTAGSGYSTCSAATCHTSPYSAGAVTSPTWGTTAANCTSCHTGVGAFTGTNTSPTTGSHSKHVTVAAGCNDCHAGAQAGVTGGTGHADGHVDVSGTKIGTGYPANITKHTAGSGYATCSVSYCHVSQYSASAVTTPSWGTVSANCSACHTGVGAFTGANTSPTTGTHTKHIAGGATCASCHAGAVGGLTGGDGHLDGNIDVVNGYPANVTKHAAGTYTGRCSTASCHGSQYGTTTSTTPTWGTTGAGCAACHSGVGAFTGTGSAPTTGSHTKHIAGAANCGDCHAGAVAGVTGGLQHADNNIDMLGTKIGAGYPTNITKHAAGSGYVKCSTATCHADPYSAGYATSPTWGTTAAACTACHTGVGAFTGTNTSPTTGSHTKHIVTAGAVCGDCHAGAQAGVTGGNGHADGHIDVTGSKVGAGYPANVTKHTAGSGYARCSAATCHADQYSAGYATTPTWGVTGSGGCAACHTGVGAFTGTNTSPTTGSHSKHINAAGAVCGDCHSGAQAGISGGVQHGDGNIDMLGSKIGSGYPTNIVKHAAGSGYSTCSAATCHGNPYSSAAGVTPTWGVAGSGGCSSCHNGVGAFTGVGSSPATGSHSKHLAGAIACGKCHTGAVAGTTGGTNHGDGNIDVATGLGYAANVTKHASGTYTGYTATCATGGCHATVTWGTTQTFDCISCHSNVLNINNGPLAGQSLTRKAVAASLKSSGTRNHKSTAVGSDASKYDCIVCHLEGDMTSGSTTAYHMNGIIDFRDPDTGSAIQAVSWSGLAVNTNDAAGRYVSTGAALTTLSRFTRDMTKPLESDPQWLNIAAVQTNLCLKCHDTNGATNTTAQTKNAGGTVIGSALQPFGNAVASTTTQTWTTATLRSAAGNTTGSVMNVADMFNPNNASYHPVSGRQNNGFTSGSRMKAPWNGATKSAVKTTTIYGYLMSCFDCHATSGATGTQVGTVVAHGNNTTGASLQMIASATWFTAASAGTPNLCTACHSDSYFGGSNHAAGSAFGSSGGSMTGTMPVCSKCHGSGQNTLAGRAADAHGFDTMHDSPTTALPTSGVRPYAFFRFYTNGGFQWGASGVGSCAGGCTASGTYTPAGAY